MARQTFLFDPSKLDVVKENVALSEIRILTWNISNPSIERACKQFDWLMKTKANILILTEAKYSKGCLHLKDALENVGFKVFFPKPTNNDYITFIALNGFQSEKWNLKFSFLPYRLESINLQTFMGDLKLIGMYVPSRGPKEIRNINKKKFQNQIINWMKPLFESDNLSNHIIGGDLNVLEPNHIPYYPIFGKWEYEFYNIFINCKFIDAYRLLHPNTRDYSWFGKSGGGYRFDHFFISKNISPHIDECYYIHEPRFSKLSDHSALWLKLK